MWQRTKKAIDTDCDGHVERLAKRCIGCMHELLAGGLGSVGGCLHGDTLLLATRKSAPAHMQSQGRQHDKGALCTQYTCMPRATIPVGTIITMAKTGI